MKRIPRLTDQQLLELHALVATAHANNYSLNFMDFPRSAGNAIGPLRPAAVLLDLIEEILEARGASSKAVSP
jgi:hypothetical protein